MRKSVVAHNQGTASIAKAAYEAREQANERANRARERACLAREEFQANQDRLRTLRNSQLMARVAAAPSTT